MNPPLENHSPDVIPHEDVFSAQKSVGAGPARAQFLAFNTAVQLDAYGDEKTCHRAFSAARDACRIYERLFSRTLPHSDIARLNNAHGERVRIDARTYNLLEQATFYCAESEGAFDITVGPLVRLWDFRAETVPAACDLAQAARHVDWHALELVRENDECFARLADPLAAVDAGGIAKGWIADALVELMSSFELSGFIVNLGGNVAVHGCKPSGEPWQVGVRSPLDPERLVGAVPLSSGSAVTSGVYERGFTKDGVRYHHILDPRTGMPVQTDVSGVTVIADKSIDAEGFSTTLLALGTKRGSALARRHPALKQVFFVSDNEHITALY